MAICIRKIHSIRKKIEARTKYNLSIDVEVEGLKFFFSLGGSTWLNYSVNGDSYRILAEGKSLKSRIDKAILIITNELKKQEHCGKRFKYLYFACDW